MDSLNDAEIGLCYSNDDQILSLKDRILLARKKEESIVQKPSFIMPAKRDHMLSDSDDSNDNEDTEDQCSIPINKIIDNYQKEPTIRKKSKNDSDGVYSETTENVMISSYTYSGFVLSDCEEEYLVKNCSEIKKSRKKNINTEKEFAKQEKLRLREEKKKEKELAKVLKQSEKEILKSKKPEECIKAMRVVIDADFKNVKNEDIFSALDEKGIQYIIQENPLNNTVLWQKKVYEVKVESNEVLKIENTESENILVVVIPNQRFTELMFTYIQRNKGKDDGEQTLLEYIMNIKSLFPEMEITCITIGFDKYARDMKEKNASDDNFKKMIRSISKLSIEEATIEVQLQSSINFNFLDNARQFGELLYRFTKAIAEAPERRKKQQQKSLAFSWYADADTNCPVKLENDRNSAMKLWQQQIQQFQNVGSEVAEAIVSKYPSPRALMEAYKKCATVKEAEELLKDIIVRRNYGPLGTQRRIGPELSFKIHLFFTSRNGNQILQR